MQVFHLVPEDKQMPTHFALLNRTHYSSCEEMEDVLTYLRLWKKFSLKELPKNAKRVDEELIEGIDLYNTDQKFISLKLTYEVVNGHNS